MEKKPNVFPTSSRMTDEMKEANEMGSKIAEEVSEQEGISKTEKSDREKEYAQKMNQESLDMLEEQMRKRDELIAKRKNDGDVGGSDDFSGEETAKVTYSDAESKPHKKLEVPEDRFEELSRPQEDSPYDVIKLPSEGLLYPNQGSSIKLSYLNASDENLITNPNLLRSGKFLEVLINRKMLGTDLRYKDLHVGDRNAIMIWLRSTGYGSMYNVMLTDPNDDYKEFETKIDLSELPIKYLDEKPDKNGHFKYKLPLSGKEVTFRMLSVGDVNDIEDHIEELVEEKGSDFADASTYTLKKQILAIDGDNNSTVVNNFIERGMRLGDVRSFRQHLNKIESGIDMNITVGTPGGGSITTFLPLNGNFFWPDTSL